MQGSRRDDVHSGRPAEARVGDTVLAQDGALGRVDWIIRTEASAPAYLVVSVRRSLRRKYPIVPWSLVTGIDRSRRCVHLRGRRGTLRQLPESLPLVL